MVHYLWVSLSGPRFGCRIYSWPPWGGPVRGVCFPAHRYHLTYYFLIPCVSERPWLYLHALNCLHVMVYMHVLLSIHFFVHTTSHGFHGCPLSPLCAALVFIMIWMPVSYWRLHVIVYHGPVMLWLSVACHIVLFACCRAHVAPHVFFQHGLFAVHSSLLFFYFELSPRH